MCIRDSNVIVPAEQLSFDALKHDPNCMTENTDSETSKRSPTTRTMAMHGDTNPAGDIFGGWVLSQMDMAAGICAGQRAQGRVVTAAIDGMRFYRPVKVGDVLGIYTSVTRVGRSSMDVLVEAWVRRDRIGVREKVTEATFSFVALGEDGKSVQLPSSDDIPEYVKEQFGDL